MPSRCSVDVGGPGLGGADDLGDEPPLSQDALDEIALLDVLGAGDDLAAGGTQDRVAAIQDALR